MNIINNKDIDTYIRELTSSSNIPSVGEWFSRVLPKKVRSLDGASSRIISPELFKKSISRLDKSVQKKLMAQFNEGLDFYFFDKESEAAEQFSQDILIVKDWLDSLPDWDRHIVGMNRMSWNDALILSQKWHSLLAKVKHDIEQMTSENFGRIHLCDGDEEVKIVELIKSNSLVLEGQRMGHCVGGSGYINAVSSGLCQIYSLRDKYNVPHVTIEVVGKKCRQIKGRGNTAPAERWAKYVRDFVVQMGLYGGHDGVRIGLVNFGTMTYRSIDDFVSTHVISEDFEPTQEFIQTVYLHRKKLTIDLTSIMLQNLDSTTHVEIASNETLVDLGSFGKVRKLRYDIKNDILKVVFNSPLIPLGDEALSFLNDALDGVFDKIRRNLKDVHIVSLNGSRLGAGALDRLCAVTGRLVDLHNLRRDIVAERNRYKLEVSSKLRLYSSPQGARLNPGIDVSKMIANVRNIPEEVIEEDSYGLSLSPS